MSTLQISSGFAFGTGVGRNDLRPVGVVIDENVLNVDLDYVIGSGLVLSGIVEDYRYVQDVNVQVIPGYFYLGDRECYCFNNKGTQVSNAEDTESGSLIFMQQYPDGPCPIELDDFTQGFLVPRDEECHGASPIIVSRYPGGTFSSESGVPFDTVMSSRVPVSGVPESGLPWIFGPDEQFAKTYDYWREGYILPPDAYAYDFRTNAIVLYESGNPLDEYVVEFELDNQPFSVDLNLNPLITVPDDYLLCLATQDDSGGDEYPESIYISVSQETVKEETIQVVVEVVSNLGNSLESVPVELVIHRPGLVIAGTSVADEDLDGVPFFVDNGPVYDRLTVNAGILVENGVQLSGANRIAGNEVVIRSAGYLYPADEAVVEQDGVVVSPAENFGYSTTVTTDSYGRAYANYRGPSRIASEFDVEIVARVGAITGSVLIQVVSSQDEGRLAIAATSERAYAAQTALNEDVPVVLEVPLDCICPSELQAEELDLHLGQVYENNLRLFYNTSEVEVLDGRLVAHFNFHANMSRYMLKYNRDPMIRALDQRSVYGV